MPESELASAPFSMKGEVALITGGATGLGFGMARAFLSSGAEVVLAGRREETLRQAARQLGPGCSYAVHDVTCDAAAESVLAEVWNRTGGITVLVNNAGIHLKKAADETTQEEFSGVLNTHVFGAFSLTRRVIPRMIRRGGGSILFIASMTSLIGMPQTVAYSAAKSAYLGMVRALATEYGPKRIRVNAIAPGWIETPMLHRALDGDPERKNRILARTPANRFGDPEDIGWAAVYLCSPAARFVNGVVLPVDGGASIGF